MVKFLWQNLVICGIKSFSGSTNAMHNAFSYYRDSNKYIFASEVPVAKCLIDRSEEVSIPNMC